MNAFHRTSHLMASTLSRVGRQLPHQEVRIVCTACSGSVLGPRYDVFVAGDYYRVREITLQQPRLGISPAELDLEPINPDAEDFD